MDATALAARLDLSLERTPVCLACLSFVSMPLGDGDMTRARREARRISLDLWAEGLESPVRQAIELARARGDPDAAEAARELEDRGGRAPVVAAVILRLAQEQARETQAALARDKSPWPVLGFKPFPPEGEEAGVR